MKISLHLSWGGNENNIGLIKAWTHLYGYKEKQISLWILIENVVEIHYFFQIIVAFKIWKSWTIIYKHFVKIFALNYSQMKQC